MNSKKLFVFLSITIFLVFAVFLIYWYMPRIDGTSPAKTVEIKQALCETIKGDLVQIRNRGWCAVYQNNTGGPNRKNDSGYVRLHWLYGEPFDLYLSNINTELVVIKVVKRSDPDFKDAARQFLGE